MVKFVYIYHKINNCYYINKYNSLFRFEFDLIDCTTVLFGDLKVYFILTTHTNSLINSKYVSTFKKEIELPLYLYK